jgi:glyoxylase I family protein
LICLVVFRRAGFGVSSETAVALGLASVGIELAKDSIDLGIVTSNVDALVDFYRDVLGFADLGETPMPGAKMRRLVCGTSAIKLIAPTRPPGAVAPSGGIHGATGYRYWTISVANLSEVVAACLAANATVAVPETTLRPGVRIAIVEDPDGNWVELLEEDLHPGFNPLS